MVDILAFGAHPDDVEFGAGAILAKMASYGKSIAIVDLTLGDKGTNGSPPIRKKEGEKAAQYIGATRDFLGFSDTEVEDTYAATLKLVEVIRELRPSLVLAPFWEGVQNHPDHIACGKLARKACRFAAFSKILPELEAWRPDGILHYPGPSLENINILVDVTPFVDVWKKMMGAHESQMKTFDYLEWNLKRAEALGVRIGSSFAQGLIASNPIVVEDIMDVARGVREF